MRPSARRVWTWAALVGATLLAPLGAQQPPAATPPPATAPQPPATQKPSGTQPPLFRSGVDIVVVEATVLDRSGAVVKGLQPSDFRVEIGGRTREVVSADLVEYQVSAPAAVTSSEISTNTTAAGRTIVIVIDQSSLESASRGVLEGVKRWLGTLPPSDRIGLVSLPPPGPRVEFTTEHARVVQAMGRVATSTSMKPIPMGGKNVSLWEALRITDGDMTVLSDVLARECAASDPLCPGDVDMTARDLAQDAQMRVQPVLASLRGLLQGLGQLPGPKHMVLLTSGWPIDERNAPTELSGLAAEASRSNVTVHSFTAEQWAMSASVSRPTPRMGFDSQMLVSSVETLAGFTGGKSSRLVGAGEGALKSLTDGLTGYYRLGVRPAPEDLDGKTRRISLKLSKEGASLKGYRRIMAGMRPASATPTVDPTTALRNALRSPVAATGLDVRATSYVMHDAGSPTGVRVVVVGDVGRAAAGPALSMTVLYDQDGKPVVGGENTIEVEPGQETAARLQTAFAVKPGSYMLRVAVRDNNGAIGMVERSVEARWLKAGAAETTGLVLFRHRPGRGSPEPMLEAVSTDDQVVAQLSLQAPDLTKTSVVIDVSKEGATTPLLKLRARIAKTSSGATIAQQAVPMALLPPGRYTMAASIDTAANARFTRTFAVDDETPVAPVETADLGSEEAPPPPPRVAPSLTQILAMTRPSRFASTSVLDPAFVSPIVERLASRPDTANVRGALEGMKMGPWPTDGAKGALAGSPLASSFIAGLARLQSGDLEGAANDFRSALRAAPDFAPAMVYLGACYAAGSRDKEAASAWQTALLRERDSPGVAALAIDAWLRSERPAPALALLKQMRARWPSDQTFVRQHAQAALAAGQTREGLEIVTGLAEPGEPLLFVALATLYHEVRANKTVWDAGRDRQVMRDLREAYAKTGGDSIALVDAWVAEVEAGG